LPLPCCCLLLRGFICLRRRPKVILTEEPRRSQSIQLGLVSCQNEAGGRERQCSHSNHLNLIPMGDLDGRSRWAIPMRDSLNFQCSYVEEPPAPLPPPPPEGFVRQDGVGAVGRCLAPAPPCAPAPAPPPAPPLGGGGSCATTAFPDEAVSAIAADLGQTAEGIVKGRASVRLFVDVGARTGRGWGGGGGACCCCCCCCVRL
jgi:hypothetical protein